jgi:hypothetical protein
MLDRSRVLQSIQAKNDLKEVVYVSDLSFYHAYTLEDVVQPQRDHMDDMLKLAIDLRT